MRESVPIVDAEPSSARKYGSAKLGSRPCGFERLRNAKESGTRCLPPAPGGVAARTIGVRYGGGALPAERWAGCDRSWRKASAATCLSEQRARPSPGAPLVALLH